MDNPDFTMYKLLILLFLGLQGRVNASCTEKNIAREGTATQTDTYVDPIKNISLSAARAIDGIKHGRHYEFDFSHTITGGPAAWWLLTLPRVCAICQITVYNRYDAPQRINGVKIWVGVGLTGGNYDGAELIGTITYQSGTYLYDFSDLTVKGSSIQIQGGTSVLSLAEVEVFADSE
ncbi:hypothetical protein ACHWQZ_G011228 [Mnemiopsis leidyi]